MDSTKTLKHQRYDSIITFVKWPFLKQKFHENIEILTCSEGFSSFYNLLQGHQIFPELAGSCLSNGVVEPEHELFHQLLVEVQLGSDGWAVGVDGVPVLVQIVQEVFFVFKFFSVFSDLEGDGSWKVCGWSLNLCDTSAIRSKSTWQLIVKKKVSVIYN